MCSNTSRWQTKTNPSSSVFSWQRNALSVVSTLWGRQTASDGGVLRTNCVTTLIISIQRALSSLCASYVGLFAFTLLIKDVGWRGWYQWSNHFQALTQQCQLVTWIQKHHTLPAANPQPPSPAQPSPCPSCLHSPGKLCISALGGKHYTGLAQGSTSLNILSWPLAVILLVARVSSSTFIRRSAEGEARESCLFISERKKTKRRQETKMCQDLLMFYSVNQRCYLTQVPYVISITLMIPKITKDFFSLHGLYEWC